MRFQKEQRTKSREQGAYEKYSKAALCSLFFVLYSLLFVTPANAISVAPAIHDLSIDPGSTVTRTIAVTNDEATTQTFIVSIQKFIPKGESGQQEFLPPSDTTGLPEWMYVDKPELSLQPGQSANMQVSMRVPEGAVPGGYYAALFLSRRQSTDEQLAMLPRIGILFFVRVNGAVEEKLVVRDISLDADSYQGLPVGFRVTVANEGGAHVVPEGNVRVTNALGIPVASFPLNPDGARVLPGSTRVFTTAWEKGFALGPHRATFTFTNAGFQDTGPRTVSFSVWPVQAILIVLALMGVAAIGFILLKKWIIKRATAVKRT